jgi:hypothetical protein
LQIDKEVRVCVSHGDTPRDANEIDVVVGVIGVEKARVVSLDRTC